MPGGQSDATPANASTPLCGNIFLPIPPQPLQASVVREGPKDKEGRRVFYKS